jgi:hypothetical protein
MVVANKIETVYEISTSLLQAWRTLHVLKYPRRRPPLQIFMSAEAQRQEKVMTQLFRFVAFGAKDKVSFHR